jgi:hypothetical protein
MWFSYALPSGSSLVLSICYVGILQILPRSMPGEATMIPWPVCVLGYLGFSTFVPWLVSFPFLRNRSLRIYLLVCLFVAVFVGYWVFGFENVLSKAYRRGL